MSYKFQNVSYKTECSVAYAMVREYISAGGLNSTNDIVELLGELPDANIAQAMYADWANEGHLPISREAIITAIAEYREDMTNGGEKD